MLEDCKSSYTELVQDWNNLLIGLSNQLDKINNSLHNTHFARNLGLIFDEHLTISDHYLICLHIFLLPHSSALLYPSIPRYKNNFHHRHFHFSLEAWLLQLSLAQPTQVSENPAPTDPELSCTCCCQSFQLQSHHSHPSVSALVKDNTAVRIEYKLLWLMYKVFTTTQPSYLLKQLITVQPHCSTRFSSLFTLARPSTSSALRITDRSFQYASPLETTPGFSPSTTH